MLDQYVLALDQGTTSSRAILFDRDGLIAASAQREFPQIYPRAGWVEHDPEAIWETQLWAMREAMALAGASAAQVTAIGITNQRETTIVWDRATGRPIHNAIVWQCRRTAPMCDVLNKEGFDAVIAERTGLVVDAYFSGTKVAWLLENIPGARDRAHRGELAFGTVDAFLLWRLSGGRLHATDVSNASRTMLYNIHAGRWDEKILQRLGVPHSMLPEVLPSSTVYGVTEAHILGRPIRLAGVAGDQQAATFGQTCFQPRMVKNTYGTGCFMLLNTGPSAVQSKNGLLTTVGWQVGSDPVSYALEGSVFVAGAAVQWLRDGLGLIRSSAEVEDLAQTVVDSDGVFVVPAFVGLGAPHWDPYARGTIVGLTRGSHAGHIARATLESIAFQTRDVVEAMVSDSGMALTALRADGGAAQNALLMQYQADLLGIPVEVPSITETTALGAAYLAGLAVGFWSGMDELAEKWSLGKRYEPTVSAERRDSWYAGWRRAVDRSRGWAV